MIMRSLFGKIFVCFLLTHILASLLTYALITATRPEPRTPRVTRTSPGARNSFRMRRYGPPRHMQRKFETMRWIAIFVAAIAVSYGLARYLTAPATTLRRATQQLADGDLSTRVAPRMGKRRDELADLGRDFDEMAERIESLVTAERRLLGDISHELRSPLARLQVALDLATQTADEPTREYLQRIEREGKRLNELIGQLLVLTQLESSALDAKREPIDVAALLAEVAADADFEARGQNRAVRVIATVAGTIAGNGDLLRSAIENVMRNAVRYTPENSEVEVSLVREQEQAVIRIRDHGPGAPEESLTKLFDPFYRVALARDRQSGGVGLGLSIAARAVRFHHGEIKAVNAPEGGLLVEIRLPLTTS